MNQHELQLQQFLDQHSLSIRAFATENGLVPSIVHRVCKGYDTCGKNWARIMRATGGRVSPLSHYPPEGRSRASRKRERRRLHEEA